MFISYAQNFEDVILWRALKHIDKGFYIDIGAQEPIADSVSLAFYENGWRGIHIEPLAAYAEALRQARPDEMVIEAIVGDRNADVTLFEIGDTGLSTTNWEVAGRQTAMGRNVQISKAKGITLSGILDANRQRDVHWLKIDVEGSEAAVIQGWGASDVRPWIVVVESVDPLTREDTSKEWEGDLCALGYEFAYFDGLNRFYVSVVHRDLKAVIAVAPNVFDDFALSGTSSAPFCYPLQQQIKILQQQIEGLRQQLSTIQEFWCSRQSRLLRLVVTAVSSSAARIRHLGSVASAVSSSAERIRRLPRAVVHQGAVLARRKAPRLYDRIALNHLARRVYSVVTRPQPSLVLSTAAPTSLAQADNAVSLTRLSLASATRSWKLGRRLDA